jgi:hypothetical protein
MSQPIPFTDGTPRCTTCHRAGHHPGTWAGHDFTTAAPEACDHGVPAPCGLCDQAAELAALEALAETAAAADQSAEAAWHYALDEVREAQQRADRLEREMMAAAAEAGRAQAAATAARMELLGATAVA